MRLLAGNKVVHGGGSDYLFSGGGRFTRKCCSWWEALNDSVFTSQPRRHRTARLQGRARTIGRGY